MMNEKKLRKWIEDWLMGNISGEVKDIALKRLDEVFE